MRSPESRIRSDRAEGGTGRPPHDGLPIARAFVAKAILNLFSTRALDERRQAIATLCRIPDRKASSARVVRFPRFLGLWPGEIPERTHAALVERFVKDSGMGEVLC